jgi:hypothetical protein
MMVLMGAVGLGAGNQEMPSPRLRPIVQLIPPVSRMMPDTCLPIAFSSTGRQGTSVKSRAFSMSAYFPSPI